MQKGQGLLQQQGSKAAPATIHPTPSASSAGPAAAASDSQNNNNNSNSNNNIVHSTHHNSNILNNTSGSGSGNNNLNNHPSPVSAPTTSSSLGISIAPGSSSSPDPPAPSSAPAPFSSPAPSPRLPLNPNFHQFHKQQPSPSHFQQQQQQQQRHQHLQQLQQQQLQLHHQQQQQQQHNQSQQQQQQQQSVAHLQSQQQSSHPLQQWKGVPPEHFPPYQSPVFTGGGGTPGTGNGPPGSAQSLMRPPRLYPDSGQHHLQAQVQAGMIETTQAMNQVYVQQQALIAAQKKAQANAQQGKPAAVAEQAGPHTSEDGNNQRQLHPRQGHPPIAKAGPQYISGDQQMDQTPETKNEANASRGQQAYTGALSNSMRNQQQLLMNGQAHTGMVPIPPQSHHMDPSSGSLMSPAQFQLMAQYAAMHKAGIDPNHLQHAASKGQDVSLRNLVPPMSQQHASTISEGLSSPNMVLGGKGHAGMPSPNLRQQSNEYSIERGVLSLNRQAGATMGMPTGPVMVNKSMTTAPLSSRPDKVSGSAVGSTPDETDVQYAKPQAGQHSNPLIQQPNFQQQQHQQQHQQQQETEHQQAMQIQQQSQHLYQQGNLRHFQQQHIKQETQQQQQQQPQPQQQVPPQAQTQQHGHPLVMHPHLQTQMRPHMQSHTHPQLQAQIRPQMQSQQHSQVSSHPNTQPQPQIQPQAHLCFTRQQLAILRSQIIAFRRLKRNESIPPEVLKSLGIDKPPSQSPSEAAPVGVKDDTEKQNTVSATNSVPVHTETKTQKVVHPERSDNSTCPPQVANVADLSNSEPKRDELPTITKPASDSMPASSTEVADSAAVNNSSIASRPCSPNNAPKKPMSTPMTQQKPMQLLRRYRGPLFDFPPVGRKIENLFQGNNPWGPPIPIGYDVRQLLLKEGARVISRKRSERLKLIDALLASGLEKKCIPADLITKLKIEQKKLRLMSLQTKIREEVEEQQQDIMAMGERVYRKFVRFCERQRMELARQVVQLQKSTREKQLKSLFSWRKRLLEAHWAVRDARTTRNRGVLKYHEKMLREFSKKRDEDRNKRMEALKNNDVDTYREMLKQQQTKLPGDAGERFQVLSSFLSQTEDYLHKLGGKISAVKYQQEREEAAVAAALAAKSQGLPEEEVEIAAARARQEVDIRLSSPDRASDSVSKYYSLAHAVNERIMRQPSMLRAGVLRDYQLVGLQWMLSLYNNRLNGILADEMGLGKTVQVMALIAYLMEFKANYGPHLIIVPNAVIVNWKSELLRWIPSVSCIFYVGGKEQRTKLYSQEVCARKFNILVTTYEFIMRDRSKLSKVDWKYLIIDEAQRMKDRESRLSRDLDRFRCQRRLLLTGTPLQNDLRELWSLLNLLLPEVFDNSKSFQDWFSMPFQRDNSSLSPEDDWLETEKKVIVIHRLHQILEPFMLRRRVEDVEGSLPPKIPIVLRCKMSALQAAIYDWIKATGTIRLDPYEEEMRVAAKNGKRQKRAYAPLQNKCMELRKVCNHPLLNYPFFGERMNEFSVRSCGKLWILDRILIKLQHTGHRVLLFSTMTKLLDILEDYLQWRGLKYRRIDGTTTLESRESAIVEFNRAGSDCFIFLLSIRAAGRGLNLQTADTVIIYDPDPNPKNEEQAVARAHRIGQKREVRVIYMEAVVETISSFEKVDEIRSGGRIDTDDDDMAGKDRYVGSVESLVRNTIQQHKIEMADEVINAGRFDQRTTHEERRLTLEALLHDEERYQERVHDVPSLQEVNRMIARTEEEVEYFDQLDEEYDWPGEMVQHHQVPKWLCVGSREVNACVGAMSKAASKKGAPVDAIGSAEAEERLALEANEKAAKKKKDINSEKRFESQNSSSKQRGSSSAGKSIASLGIAEDSQQKDAFDDEEEGEIRREMDDEDPDADLNTEPEEGELSDEELEAVQQHKPGMMRPIPVENNQEHSMDRPSESSQDEEEEVACRNEVQNVLTHSLSQQKFGSLAALESRPKSQGDELEEGEIAASGDSRFEGQPSGSSAPDADDGEEEQAVHLPIKRKRSARQPRKRPLEKIGAAGPVVSSGKINERRLPQSYPFMQHPIERPVQEHSKAFHQPAERAERQAQRFHDEEGRHMEAMLRRPEQSLPPAKRRQIMEPLIGKKPVESFNNQQPLNVIPKHSRMPPFADQFNNMVDQSHKESGKLMGRIGGPCTVMLGKMPESIQKKCKVVLQRLKGIVEKDGHQSSIIFELPKRSTSPGYYKLIANPIDARTIEERLDRFEYASVIDYASDVLLMLENAAKFYKSPEVVSNNKAVKAYIRRLQAIYFQSMHHKFQDIDFGSLKTRNLATLNPNTPNSGSSSRPHISVGRSQAEVPMSLTPRSITKASEIDEERLSGRGAVSESKKPQKKMKPIPVVQKASERIKMKLEHGRGGSTDFDEIPHPLDMVLCKKKRRPRGRPQNKMRMINADTHLGRNTGSGKVGFDSDNRGVKIVGKKMRTVGIGGNDNNRHSGSLKMGTNFMPSPVPGQRPMEKVQQVQGLNRGPISLGSDQWLLTPVKKMRTDGGKRRPSYV